MEALQSPRKTHPMFLVAAASVTAFSLAGVASLAGWLPTRSEAPATAAAALAAAPAAVSPAPSVPLAKADAPATLHIPAGTTVTVEPKARAATSTASRAPSRPAPVASQEAVPENAPRATRVSSPQPVADNGIYVENARPAQTTQPAPQARSQTPATCYDCGTVESVREIAQKGEGTGLGAIAGGVLGGLLGSQIGGGNGKKAMAVVGAAGGAYAGHEVEKRMRGETQYEITVRFDDGRTRTYVEPQTPQLQSGDRVRLDNGRLTMI